MFFEWLKIVGVNNNLTNSSSNSKRNEKYYHVYFNWSVRG